MSWVPVLHSPPPSGAHPLKLGPGLAGGGAEPKHKKISDFQGQQFQIALILNGTSGAIRGINISMQSLPFVEAFAEVWVESSWVLLCLCFSPLERNLGCVFIPRTSRGACLLPKPPEEGIKLRSEPCAGFAGRSGEGLTSCLTPFHSVLIFR